MIFGMTWRAFIAYLGWVSLWSLLGATLARAGVPWPGWVLSSICAVIGGQVWAVTTDQWPFEDTGTC